MSNNEVLEVLVDRSQGTTKITEDQLEIMVHRRLFKVMLDPKNEFMKIFLNDFSSICDEFSKIGQIYHF